jgi:hypothetical protein
LTLERIENELASDNSLRVTELAQVASSVGRVSGVQQEDTKEGTISIHIVRDALPPHIQARMLSAGDAVREVDDVNDSGV